MNPHDSLVVHVERDEEETALADTAHQPVVRVYLNAKQYILAAGDQAVRVEREWAGSVMAHLFIPVPPNAPVYSGPPASIHKESS